MQDYLESSTYIDWAQPDVLSMAAKLADKESDRTEVARRCFLFVRDEIRHCYDGNDEVLTVKASEERYCMPALASVMPKPSIGCAVACCMCQS